MNRIKIGLFGTNGHQITDEVKNMIDVELVAVAEWPQDSLDCLPQHVMVYDTLEQLLQHPGLQLVSLCSPVREQQTEHILKALQVGCHVYVEKPMVMNIEDLQAILALARKRNLYVREMAGTAYQSPYMCFRRLIQQGHIGHAVQYFAQKSYPYAQWRPQDEAIDGGILLQAGIHLVRAIEYISGKPVIAVSAIQSKLGNPHPTGGLHMASNLHMQLADGTIGVAIINYLNVASSQVWGYDRLTVFGSKGFVEWSAQHNQVEMYLQSERKAFDCHSKNHFSHFQHFIYEICGQPHDLMPVASELHPLQVMLAARQSAQNEGTFISVSADLS